MAQEVGSGKSSTKVDYGAFYSQGGLPTVTAPRVPNPPPAGTFLAPQAPAPTQASQPTPLSQPTQQQQQISQPDPYDYTGYVPAHAAQIPNTPFPGSFGFDGNLSQQQLTEAARLTSVAMFGPVFNQTLAQQIIDAGINPFPIKISTDLANELPFAPKSEALTAAFEDAFGVPSFGTAEDMLSAMNYFEYEPGQWWRADQTQFYDSGTGTYNYGYGGRGSYRSQPRAYSYGGGGLVNWRIGL